MNLQSQTGGTNQLGLQRHVHSTCSHELHHCAHCDIAYCGKCNKEWGQKSQTSNWPFPGTPMPYAGGSGATTVLLATNAIAGEGMQRGVFHTHEQKE